jgi:UDP-GlcNAc:undecaprenyl-phosphate GlcNAc-1-phosphate transferase
MKTYLTFIISFLVVYLSMPVFRGLAVRFKILDLPGGRKMHQVATPLLGGAALYLGLLAGILFNLSQLQHFVPVLLGATLILILGLANDVKELSARLRFLFQVLIALVVISMGVRVSFLPLGWWKDIGEALLTLFWMVGVTNAYNYLDGLDGLAAGSAAVNLACFAIILYMTGQSSLALLSVILIAVCLGFLPYNFRKEKVFLGEAGSTFLGFILASIAILGNWAADNIVKISIPILILGVPIFDMIFTTVMRIREEKIKTVLEWLSYGGRDHFHHYLIDLGFQSLGAVMFIYFVTLSLGLSAIMVSNDLAIEAFLTISQAAIIFGIIATLIVMGKRHRGGVV